MGEKWNNLFWHQRQRGDQTSAKNIENNMTKDLVFILTNPNCKSFQKEFVKLLKRKMQGNGVEPPSRALVYSKCQANINHVSADKARYLVSLTSSKCSEGPTRNAPISDTKDGQRSIYDAVLEYGNCVIVLEVKTTPHKNKNQIKKYDRDLDSKETIDVTWDDVYSALKEAKGKTGNEVEKLLVNQYLELLRVMDLTKMFDGFKGETPEEHSAELRNLLSWLKEDGCITYYDKKKKTKNPWYWVSFEGNKKSKPHITLYRNNQSFECLLTDMWPDEKKYSKELAKRLGEISKWNRDTEGEEKEGRVFSFSAQDYRSYSRLQQGAHYTDAAICIRLDSRKGGEIQDIIKDSYETLKRLGGRRKQAQIGFRWSLEYNSPSNNHLSTKWENDKHAFQQTKEAIGQLKKLYEVLKR